MIASVVVPAHNEEAILGTSLRCLAEGFMPGELDVVVVANACRDLTAQVALSEGARVIETSVPGKRHALGLGDAACRTFPRFYVDADVLLSAASLKALITALERPGVLACAPAPVWDLEGASWLMRRVHQVHDALMATRRGLAGAGVYGLNEQGHDRAFPIPEVVADDEWVHRVFTARERVVVHEAASTVRPARTVRVHLRRRVRVRLGNKQLAELGRPAPDGQLRLRVIGRLIADRSVSVADALCYLVVKVAERMLAARYARRDSEITWFRDEASRSAP